MVQPDLNHIQKQFICAQCIQDMKKKGQFPGKRLQRGIETHILMYFESTQLKIYIFDIYLDATSFGMFPMLIGLDPCLGIVRLYLAQGNYTPFGVKARVTYFPLKQEIMCSLESFSLMQMDASLMHVKMLEL